MSINWWFTADTHFSHGNIIKYCARPFFNDAEKHIYFSSVAKNACPEAKKALAEMHLSAESIIKHDDQLIENWNQWVKPNDKVLHLGDFAFASPERINRILDRLHGSICLILGNHDKNAKKVAERFEWVDNYREVSIQTKSAKAHRIVLSHYALRVWHAAHLGAWHLYGHSHGNLNEDNAGQAMDVGVDAVAKRLSGTLSQNELCKPEHYRPLHIEEIELIMEGKKKS